MTKPENHPVPRHERVSGSTPDLFERCGVALCQGDPAWKARFAKMLRMSVDSVDAMAKGKSRVPPNVWREIAAIFRAWEQAYPILREAAIEAAGGPLPVRRYTFPGGAELPIEAKEGGVFPAIEYTAGTNGDWRIGWWAVLPDDERVLPENSLAYRLRYPGQSEPAGPFLVARKTG